MTIQEIKSYPLGIVSYTDAQRKELFEWLMYNSDKYTKEEWKAVKIINPVKNHWHWTVLKSEKLFS